MTSAHEPADDVELHAYADGLLDPVRVPAVEARLAADPVAATQLLTDRIEAQIRRVPEQWVWMHRRWRRQPPPRESAATAVGGRSAVPAP